MFNWIVSDTEQYLEQFNFVNLCLQIIYILMYMYKSNLTLNKQQCLICYKSKPNQTIIHILLYGLVFANGPEDRGLIPGRVIPKI